MPPRRSSGGGGAAAADPNVDRFHNAMRSKAVRTACRINTVRHERVTYRAFEFWYWGVMYRAFYQRLKDLEQQGKPLAAEGFYPTADMDSASHERIEVSSLTDFPVGGT